LYCRKAVRKKGLIAPFQVTNTSWLFCQIGLIKNGLYLDKKDKYLNSMGFFFISFLTEKVVSLQEKQPC